MSCSMMRIEISAGSGGEYVENAVRLVRGHPAAGSSSSSTRGRMPSAMAISTSLCFAVGQIADALRGVVLQARASSAAPRTRDDLRVSATRPPHPGRDALALRDASATLSSTDRLRNSELIWKVRPMPRFTRFDWPSAVTSFAAEQDGAGARRERAGQHV